jgi:hypothetical protein
MFEKGDRIKLVSMPDDPNPIEVGAMGTVRRVTEIPGHWTSISVDWDNGRTLNLSIPPDTAVKVNNG